jgi:general stress protein YciG
MENIERENNTHRRGFASMDRDRVRSIASSGGKAAHQKGTAHEFNPDEAREAGRKGGKARAANRLIERGMGGIMGI